ncbi:MAG: hypothetical protein AAFY73_10175 [Pseudomonadota bacterium]
MCVVVLMMLVPLSGCGTMASGAIDAPAVECELFAPIAWSRKDTLETIREVKVHNAVWLEICR